MKKYYLLLSMLFFAAFSFTSCDLFEDDDDKPIVTHEYSSESITTNVSWSAGTYEIEGTLTIEDGGHLTIAPGSTVKFHPGADIYVTGSNSTLTANGTIDQPITFTSISNTPAAGDWDYIGFDATASGNNSMQYCIVEYAGGYADTYGGAIWNEGAKIIVDNCTIRYSGYHGVVCEDEGFFNSFTNNTLTDNRAYDIEIQGNYAHTIGVGNILDGKGILVNGDDIEQANATWLLQTAPYTIDGSTNIKSGAGAKLTIAAGNTIQFTNGSQIEVGASDAYGTLIAQGTEELPILFTSTSVQKAPGQWDYIYFGNGATNACVMDYCIVEAGGGYADSYGGAIWNEDAQIAINNCTIRYSGYYGIECGDDGSFTSFTNNTFDENTTYDINISGKFAHTIGTGNTYGTANGIKVYAATINQSNVTWVAQPTAYVIDGALYVESASGSTLSIEAGTIVKFTSGSEIRIGTGDFGKLTANGTASDPIIFTTSAPAGGENPGQWDGIFFGSNTMNGSILNYCELSYGGGYADTYNNGNINLNDVPVGLPTISNCTLSYSAGWGIYSDGSSASLENNTFINNNMGDIGNKKGMIQ